MSDQGTKELAALAGTSDEAVVKATGRSWAEWVERLDVAGAVALEHKAIVALVEEAHDAGGWWSQTVTVGYERIRGLREQGQRRGGTFEVNRSATFPVGVERLWEVTQSPATLARWATGLDLEESTSTPSRSIRWKVGDGTRVEAWFTDKGPGRSSVQFQHRGLPDRETADRVREQWGDRLAALKQLMG